MAKRLRFNLKNWKGIYTLIIMPLVLLFGLVILYYLFKGAKARFTPDRLQIARMVTLITEGMGAFTFYTMLRMRYQSIFMNYTFLTCIVITAFVCSLTKNEIVLFVGGTTLYSLAVIGMFTFTKSRRK